MRLAKEKKTNLVPFRFQTVDSKHDLLQLHRCTTGSTLEPCTFPDTNPLSQLEEYMGRSHERRGIYIPSPSRIKEDGVFDSMEDVEISQSTDDAEEDNGFNRSIGSMKSKGSEEGLHGGTPTEKWEWYDKLSGNIIFIYTVHLG